MGSNVLLRLLRTTMISCEVNMPIEIVSPAATFCAQCGKIAGGVHKCGRCGKTFCSNHAHLLALAHTNGTDAVYACEECIDREHLHVIDTNHPFYMKGQPK